MQKKKEQVKVSDIIDNKDKFVAFSNLTKADIKKIFFRPGDVDIKDLDTMKYQWDLPLYAKIIFRFVQNDCQVCGMYWGLDPNCQRRLRYNFKLYDGVLDMNRSPNFEEIANFFCWIKNSFGLCELLEVEGTLNQANLNKGWESAKLYHNWKKNVVTYFYELTEDQQKKIIDKYNIIVSLFDVSETSQ